MEWKRGPTIGRGSSASVSLATSVSGELFAVKSVELSSSSLLQKEKELISQLCSPYVVKCFGSEITCEEKKEIYNLFLEYVPGGTLSNLIAKRGGCLEERVIQFYAHQMVQGLDYLHRKGLVHCDIKGQNVLICSDGGLKIADFGCAKWMDGISPSAFAGTPAFMAPEVARGEEQGFPADVWALGCTVIEMATGSNPWPEMKDPASALYRIAYSGDLPEFPSWFSGNAKDFLSKCLMRDSKDRWTAAELLQHPFLCSVVENCREIQEFTKKSPTSVMDQGFWDDFEASVSSRNPTFVASSSDSPASRIGALIGGNFSNFSDWTEDEDWVTVRSNGSEGFSEVVQQNSDMIQDFQDSVNTESLRFSNIILEEEEIQASIAIEYSIFSDSIDEISRTFYHENSSEFPLMIDGSVRDISLLRNFDFEKNSMESLFSFFIRSINFSNPLLAFPLSYAILFYRFVFMKGCNLRSCRCADVCIQIFLGGTRFVIKGIIIWDSNTLNLKKCIF